MYEIKISFGSFTNDIDDYVLTWKVLDHEGARSWFDLFRKELQTDRKYFFRFTGFVHSTKDERFLLKNLEAHIAVINADGRYHIPEEAVKFDQNFSNKIHHHFEILAGSLDDPTEYYLNSPHEVKLAVVGLNHSIHDLEAYTRNLELQNEQGEVDVFSGVILEIHQCDRIIIPESFSRLFTLNIEFGDMVLHYSQIGKTWLEAFYDEDTDIFDSGIRPQYALSGEFDLLFGQLSPDEDYLKRLDTFLKKRGKDIRDQSLRLGHLPVAKLQGNICDPRIVKREIGIRSDVKKITIYHDGRLLQEKVFLTRPTTY